MLTRTHIILLPVLFTGALGCGDDGMAPGDGSMLDGGGMDGPGLDSSRDAAPPPVLPTCAMPRMVQGEIGMVTVTGDTTGGAAGSLTLGEGCGGMGAAAQFVVAYEAPGSGPVAIEFTTVDPGTPMTFDTVVEVRTDCAMAPDAVGQTCFDDSGMDLRSTGITSAMGGDTVFFVVTGYAGSMAPNTDEGPFTLQITARANNLPTVTGGEVRALMTRAEVEISGTDTDGDGALGFRARFVDMAGMPVDMDVDGDGSLDGNEVVAPFDNDLTGMMMFTGTTDFAELGEALRFAMPGMPTHADVEIIDEAFAFGPMMRVPVRYLTEVGLGAMCTGDNVCAAGLTCDATMVCVAAPEVLTACTGATALTVAPPTTTITTASATGTIMMGDGLFNGTCTDFAKLSPVEASAGREALYSVVVPAGMVDLVARTDQAGTMDTDTIVYIRSNCPDPITTRACSDDIDTEGEIYTSLAEVRDAPAGTYTVFVEVFGGVDEGSAPFELQVGLRPVLATGAACDPMGVMNRCAGGACPMATMMCP
jgi:hypothetical protein